MDIKNNKYKRIVGGKAVDDKLRNMLKLQIMQYDENEAKISPTKKRVKLIHNSIVVIFFAILLTAVVMFIIINSSHPFTPMGVVRQYIYAVENNDLEKAEQLIRPDYEMNHDFLNVEEFSFKLAYNEHRHPNDKTRSTVDLWVEYLDEEVDEFLFWLRKIDGKWYIITRDKGESSLATGIMRYTPDKDEPQDLQVDFFYTFSNEELVEQADVIAKIKVEEISHIMITSMDKSIFEQESMYGKFRVMDIYFTKDKKVKKNSLLDIWIDYDPAFANIAAPGIEFDGEYIVFLKKLDKDYPQAWEFFDYFLINDFVKHKMEMSDENEALVRKLIKRLR